MGIRICLQPIKPDHSTGTLLFCSFEAGLCDYLAFLSFYNRKAYQQLICRDKLANIEPLFWYMLTAAPLCPESLPFIIAGYVCLDVSANRSVYKFCYICLQGLLTYCSPYLSDAWSLPFISYFVLYHRPSRKTFGKLFDLSFQILSYFLYSWQQWY